MLLSRERRQAEALRQLEAKNKGLLAQLAQMKEAEGKAEASLHAAKHMAKRQEERIVALTDAVNENQSTTTTTTAAAAATRSRVEPALEEAAPALVPLRP